MEADAQPSPSLDAVWSAVSELWNTPLDEKAAADYLGVPVSTLHRLRRSGQLPSERVGLRHFGFRRSDLFSLLPTLAQADDAPVTRLVNGFLSHALDSGASDALFEPDRRCLRTRFRCDGVSREIANLPKHLETTVISRLQTMAGVSRDTTTAQTGIIPITHDTLSFRVRATFFPSQYGTAASLHILDPVLLGKKWDTMGWDLAVYYRVSEVDLWRRGLFLLAGPPGSGRTTTAYRLLNRMNTAEKALVTVEDFIECPVPGVTQTMLFQPGKTEWLSRRAVMQTALRHSPFSLFVGDIRDAETAELAVQAAQSGARVLATVGAVDSLSALDSLVSFGISPAQVARTVTGVLAQHLVPRVLDTGETRGQIGIFEHISRNAEIGELLRRGAGQEDLREASLANGTRFFSQLLDAQRGEDGTLPEAYHDFAASLPTEQGSQFSRSRRG